MKQIKAALVGIPLVGGVVGGVALLLTKPLFFILALVIVAVLYVGYMVGLELTEKK